MNVVTQPVLHSIDLRLHWVRTDNKKLHREATQLHYTRRYSITYAGDCYQHVATYNIPSVAAVVVVARGKGEWRPKRKVAVVPIK